MYIQTIELENWVRFQGIQRLSLEPVVYGVTACQNDNPNRSNWLGKSSFLEAIPFALYGDHRYTLENDFMFRGSKLSRVTLEFSNGLKIIRSRTTVTRVVVAHGGKTFEGEPAEQYIEKILNMNMSDYYSTLFFKQRNLAKFITCEPAERMEKVKNWFRLFDLENCSNMAKKRIANNENMLAQQQIVFNQSEQLVKDNLNKLNSLNSIISTNESINSKNYQKVCDKAIENIDKRIDIIAGKIATYQQQMDNIIEYSKHEKNTETMSELIKEAQLLKSSITVSSEVLNRTVESVLKSYQQSNAFYESATREKNNLNNIVVNGFDGVCPVFKGQCPSSIEVNNKMQQIKKQLDSAIERANGHYENMMAEKKNLDNARHNYNDTLRKETQLESYREMYRKLKASEEYIKAHKKPDDIIEDQGLGTMVDLQVEKNTIEQCKSVITSELDRMAKSYVNMNVTRTEIEMHEILGVVFGQGGIQRTIAEKALKEIEAKANALLSGVGIDLNTKINWFTESKKVSNNCEECGLAYPPSAKIKQCSRCGTPRGNNKQYKLTVTLSDRSGAAEDLAGAAYQLAATNWLREERSLPLGVICIDEPFGQLDGEHKRIFANHLATMLKVQYGCEQAFIVAHDQGIMNDYPGCIEITGYKTHSEIKVK